MEIEQKRADAINLQPGSLTGYDCPECLNRGYFVRVDDQCRRVSVECKCMATRRSLDSIQKSGLSQLMERYTFDAWETRHNWQKKALEMAKNYVAHASGRWFMMSGRPGSGKTHLCTAICGTLMERGYRVKYMLWRDVSVQAKACVNDDEEYRNIVEPLKKVPVLYIDDLFKAGRDDRGNLKVTPGDVHLAFEIINTRYNDRTKLTIISTERNVDEIIDIDEAIGSRIYERTRLFYLQLDGAENWRMK